jgi:AcrR family transcriptional regulator
VSEPDRPRSANRRSYESPLRERQAQRTRDDILDALTRLLQDKRSDEITTRELARDAGVSERTVYRHFPDRWALVDALSARMNGYAGRPEVPQRLEDLRTVVVEVMAVLEAHHVEARAEALVNADPRRYTTATREHTQRLQELIEAALPELDDEQQRAIAALARVLMSSQTWLRMREELGIGGEASGPIVAWAIDALVNEVQRGNPPPTAPNRPADVGRGRES